MIRFGRPAGYTLLELLVCIALIGVLVGLIVPAVQKVRAAADRTRCQSGLRQVGLALHHYHDVAGHLPSGVRDDGPGEEHPFLSWCARLLPYVEEGQMWTSILAAFRADRNFLHNPPHEMAGRPVRAFSCPSDGRVRTSAVVGGGPRAFTSYVGVNGTRAFNEDGVLYLNSKTKFADVTDGLSATIMVGERPPSASLVLGWWYAGWGQDKDGEGDFVLGTRTRNTSVYGQDCDKIGPFEYRPGKFDDPCSAFQFWSPHPGGAHFLLADGSVRFVSYSAAPLLPALATRSGGESADLPD
jgi:prepilin-type N-terminal cleavage/methylation domain-containing protein/prepilin-type processing-associated H-X9-DG protein